jgi:hypothetical protein
MRPRAIWGHRSLPRALLALLLAVVYLTVFFAHDLLVLRISYIPKDNGNTDQCNAFFGRALKKADDHHCPFCSGFCDNHSELGIISRALPTGCIPSFCNALGVFDIQQVKHPRAPPIQPIQA